MYRVSTIPLPDSVRAELDQIAHVDASARRVVIFALKAMATAALVIIALVALEEASYDPTAAIRNCSLREPWQSLNSLPFFVSIAGIAATCFAVTRRRRLLGRAERAQKDLAAGECVRVELAITEQNIGVSTKESWLLFLPHGSAQTLMLVFNFGDGLDRRLPVLGEEEGWPALWRWIKTPYLQLMSEVEAAGAVVPATRAELPLEKSRLNEVLPRQWRKMDGELLDVPFDCIVELSGEKRRKKHIKGAGAKRPAKMPVSSAAVPEAVKPVRAEA